jgi:hypothetical protein
MNLASINTFIIYSAGHLTYEHLSIQCGTNFFEASQLILTIWWPGAYFLQCVNLNRTSHVLLNMDDRD